MQSVTILKRKYRELSGAIHNHSCFSYDCDICLDTILKAAHKHRLDYFTLNDHQAVVDQETLEKSLERFRTEKAYLPFVFGGSELNDPDDRHHLLVFESALPADNLPVEEYIERVREEKGFLFAAHPFEKRVCKDYPLYIWDKTELLEKVDGLEIWNFSSSWLSKLHPRRNGFLLLFFPGWYVRNPFPENLKLWDDLNRKGKRISAIGSTDAHGTRHQLLFIKFRILTHNYLFRTIRTNVLLSEEIVPSKNNILQALKRGNSYIVNYRQGYPYRFYAGIGNRTGKGVSFGEEIKWEKGLEFFYNLPHPATVKLIKDGIMIKKEKRKCGSFPIASPGFYRLQVERLGAAWIITNNIYVVSPD
jgi:hypothetical protein